MKTAPFDLDKALAGHPLVTRNGQLVTQFYPRKDDPDGLYPYTAVLEEGAEEYFTPNGRYWGLGVDRDEDLFLLLEPSSRQQVGGAHYKSLPIQPAEYCQRNKLTWCEANVVKYVTRHREKGGRQDIEKAIHYLELLLELEYPTEQKP